MKMSRFFRLRSEQSAMLATTAVTELSRAKHEDDATRWAELAEIAERDEESTPTTPEP